MDSDTLHYFKEFCSPECDRFVFLTNYLSQKNIPFVVLSVGDSRFIYIRFDDSHYEAEHNYLKIFFAHYDRNKNTIGANDNSAAVFELVEFAEELGQLNIKHNCQIIFTDHEEIEYDSSVKNQGAYKLAALFKQKKIMNCLFLNFDMCGRGNTVVLSESGEKLLESRKKTNMLIYSKLKMFKNIAIRLLLSLKKGRYIHLHTPFSDNLGFILNEFPVLQFTLLPHEEALQYQKDLQVLKKEVVNTERNLTVRQHDFFKKRYREIQPATWQIRHTMEDTIESLTDISFDIVKELLHKLALLKIKV